MERSELTGFREEIRHFVREALPESLRAVRGGTQRRIDTRPATVSATPL